MAKTTKKTTTKKADAPKTADDPLGVPKSPAAPVAPPKLVTPAEPIVSAGELRKPDLVDAVVARTGSKPRDVKPILDAVLAVMGEAVAEGQSLSLQPFGKLKLQRVKDTDNARITIAKLRQPKA